VDQLDALTRDELRELAKERDLPGRSAMTKAELRQALEPPQEGQGQPERPVDRLDALTRDELRELAKERDLPGRSAMTKDELRQALEPPQEGQGQPERPQAASRFEQFRLLAEASARGECWVLPRLLTGNDRRLHVRQTLREDHQVRIAHRAEDTQLKFDKLAGSLYAFFRGTALLFYRDMAGEDAWMPTVLTLGDVHPENFGVMPNAHNVPIFGVNDFDEVYYAPFTWDLKRGAVGFMIAADEIAGYGPKRQRQIADRFVRGYIKGIHQFAEDRGEQDHERRIDNAPELIRTLIEGAQQDRAEWLAEDYLDEFKRGFRADDELVPLSRRRDEFQELMNRLVAENDIKTPARAGDLRVKDVAMRRGQGTASLGLPRYYVLIEGPRADGTDDLIIELKQARRSALAGLVPPTKHRFDVPGERIVHGQAVHLVRGDVFYGSVQFEGMSFMSRERAPFRDDIDLQDLSKSEWKDYAEICGETLAHAHALSDETGQIEHDLEPRIIEAIGSPELFVDDIVRFAEEAAERLRRDHAAFCEDHRLAAFRQIDIVYR
jgi:uncharacterized protein (DUF2252 family)